MLGSAREEKRTYDELLVRLETGLGSEGGPAPGPAPPPRGRAATATMPPK